MWDPSVSRQVPCSRTLALCVACVESCGPLLAGRGGAAVGLPVAAVPAFILRWAQSQGLSWGRAEDSASPSDLAEVKDLHRPLSWRGA